MVDIHDKATRSYNMSRIRNKNTSPEIILRKKLFGSGYRYRVHYKKLTGKPDIVLPKYKTVIFINGCFWHGHEGCKYFVYPKTRQEWWFNKISKTKKRDLSNIEELTKLGWNVKVIWECELKKGNIGKVFNKIILFLEKNLQR